MARVSGVDPPEFYPPCRQRRRYHEPCQPYGFKAVIPEETPSLATIMVLITKDPSMSNPQLNLAVVIISCDNYSDLWPPFVAQFRKFWPACPYPVYLTSNKKVASFENVTSLTVGEDLSWSGNLKLALQAIPEEYVLMFIEDLILLAPVKEAELSSVLAWAAESRPNHVRLNHTEPPTHRFNKFVGLVSPGAPYRTSTVLSLWNKATLDKLLVNGESAWEFEIVGSRRSDEFSDFYSVYQNCFPVLNGVIKGKWTRQAAEMLTEQGVCIDLEARAVMTWPEAIRHYLIVYRSRLFKIIPWKLRRRIRIALMR